MSSSHESSFSGLVLLFERLLPTTFHFLRSTNCFYHRFKDKDVVELMKLHKELD